MTTSTDSSSETTSSTASPNTSTALFEYNFAKRKQKIGTKFGKTKEYRKPPRIWGGGVARPLPYWLGCEISGARP